MSLFTHPEGPPSDNDMELLVCDLLFAGKVDAAFELASVMIGHWLEMSVEQRDEHHTRGFYLWLGIKSSTAHVMFGRDRRRENRRLYGRSTMRALDKARAR